MIRKFGKWMPRVDREAIIDGSAIIMGNVTIEKAFIFPQAMIRADEHEAIIKDGAAILDRAFIEAHEKVVIGEGSIVSHGAIVHGGNIGKNALVGIGAIILGASVGDNSIIAAGSVVKDDVENGIMVAGIPAKKVRSVNEKDMEHMEKIRNEIKMKARWLK